MAGKSGPSVPHAEESEISTQKPGAGRSRKGVTRRQQRVGGFEPPVYGFVAVETRVLRSLLSGPAYRVITVVAPPGYGKSVLMSQLYQAYSRETQCLWIGLNDHPIDLAALLNLIEACLGIERPDEELSVLVEGHDQVLSRIDHILVALAQDGRARYLFIDNLNACDDEGLPELMDALVFRAARQVRIIVSSTRAIPFNSAQALLEMKLRRLSAMELGFDFDDTQAVLSQAGMSDLPVDTVSDIVGRTEGWPAAVRLAQLLIQGQGLGASVLENLSSADGDFASLLSKKLIATFPPGLTEFLLDIASLRSFSIELAEFSTNDEAARDHVDYLIKRNVLIIPVTRDGHWLRFHSLFREFLIKEARRVGREARQQEVCARASIWFEQAGDLDSALESALLAHKPENAARLLDEIARPMVRDRGELSSFLALVRQVEAAGVLVGPDSMFWQAWAMAFSRNYAGARRTLARLREAQANLPPGSDMTRSVFNRAALIDIIVNFHLDDLDSVIVAAPDWLDDERRQLLGEGRHFFARASVSAGYALACAAQHDFLRANEAVREVQDAINRTESAYGRIWGILVGATIEIAQGDPLVAKRYVDLINSTDADLLSQNPGIASVLTLTKARIAADFGDTAHAIELIQQGLIHGVENGVLDICWQVFEVILDETDDARLAVPVNELRAIALRFGQRLSLLLEYAETRRLLRAGAHDAARANARKLGLLEPSGDHADRWGNGAAMLRFKRDATMIEFLIEDGHLRQAEEMIGLEIPKAETQGRRGDLIELLLLDMKLAQRRGDHAKASAYLARAVVKASRTDMLRPFLAMGRAVAELITTTQMKQFGLTRDPDRKLLATLCEKLGVSPQGSGDVEALDAMTPREVELLRRLAEGLSNGQIATQLGLTLPTVKWHLANIYSKLGVKNRASALVRARSLGVL